MDLDKYKAKIREFANERDWDQFHDPKNLSMALSAEIGELLDVFQWLTSEQSKNLSDNDLKLAKEELGDIMIYLIRLSDKLGIDLEEAIKWMNLPRDIGLHPDTGEMVQSGFTRKPVVRMKIKGGGDKAFIYLNLKNIEEKFDTQLN